MPAGLGGWLLASTLNLEASPDPPDPPGPTPQMTGSLAALKETYNDKAFYDSIKKAPAIKDKETGLFVSQTPKKSVGHLERNKETGRWRNESTREWEQLPGMKAILEEARVRSLERR